VPARSVAATPPVVPTTSSAVAVAGATVMVDELEVEEVGVDAVVDGAVEAVDVARVLPLVEELADVSLEDLPQPASSSATMVSAPRRTRVCRLFMALVSPESTFRSSLQAAARTP
jgi:hypothetical protein